MQQGEERYILRNQHGIPFSLVEAQANITSVTWDYSSTLDTRLDFRCAFVGIWCVIATPMFVARTPTTVWSVKIQPQCCPSCRSRNKQWGKPWRVGLWAGEKLTSARGKFYITAAVEKKAGGSRTFFSFVDGFWRRFLWLFLVTQSVSTTPWIDSFYGLLLWHSIHAFLYALVCV